MPDQKRMTVAEFAGSIKAKYPQYADMSDGELARSMIEKYPVYASQVDMRTFQPRAESPSKKGTVLGAIAGSPAGAMLRNVKETLEGAGKGVIETATTAMRVLPPTTGAGLIGAIPAVKRFVNDPDLPAALEPENTPERIGKGAEAVAEFMTGEGALAKAVPLAAAKAPAIAKAGGRVLRAAGVGGADAALHNQDPRAGAALAAAGGALGEGLSALGPWLVRGAREMYAKALGATTRADKKLAEKVVPGLIDRGVRGSREKIAERTAAEADDAAQAIDEAWNALPPDTSIPAATLTAPLRSESARLAGMGPEGVREARYLDALVKTIDDSATPQGEVLVGRVRELRRFWDEVVARKSGYAGGGQGPKEAAHRFAANELRQELAKASPDIAKLNETFTFWKRAHTVVSNTLTRTAPQSVPLGEQLAGAAGAAAGLARGNVAGAVVNAVALKAVRQATTSSYWRTTSAVKRDQLAKLLASEKWVDATSLARGIANGVYVTKPLQSSTAATERRREAIDKAKIELSRDGITSDQREAYRPVASELLRRGIDPSDEYDTPEDTWRAVKSFIPSVFSKEAQTHRSLASPAETEDAWRLYLGIPQVRGTFAISDYTPSHEKGDVPYYFKMANFWPRYIEQDGSASASATIQSLVEDIDREGGQALRADDVLGDYTLSRGKDRRGHYIAYYDKWDLMPSVSEGSRFDLTGFVGKPLEIYDRLYYDPKTFRPTDPILAKSLPQPAAHDGESDNDGPVMGNTLRSTKDQGGGQ